MISRKYSVQEDSSRREPRLKDYLNNYNPDKDKRERKEKSTITLEDLLRKR